MLTPWPEMKAEGKAFVNRDPGRCPGVACPRLTRHQVPCNAKTCKCPRCSCPGCRARTDHAHGQGGAR